MFRLSDDPHTAQRQMEALIFCLTTFGYIDGDFDDSERSFVKRTIERLVADRIGRAADTADGALLREWFAKVRNHYLEELERVDTYIQEMFAETTAADEDQLTFVLTRLKLRCIEIFQQFDRADQDTIIDLVDALLYADGVAHPSEVRFRSELAALLDEVPDLPALAAAAPGSAVRVFAPHPAPCTPEPLPLLDRFEFHYARDPDKLRAQLAADQSLIARAQSILDAQRKEGAGWLAGRDSFATFSGPPFLDGYVYALPARPDTTYELTVFGDLHGAYSCLKAGLVQSRFFEKRARFLDDPVHHPEPKLVFLGDYIDRGIHSLDGVLRAVTQLFVSMPDAVYMLRGNHEMYFEYNDELYGGVKPAEAINSLKPHVESPWLRPFMEFFERLPVALVAKDVLFVHGGVPKDATIKEKYRDLSSLNDPDIRFEMLWGDPSMADVVPSSLQKQSVRFPYGKLQAAAFLQRIGCHTLVRGHEKVLDGFDHTYDDPAIQAFTLFSCGGIDNDDFPPRSGFRKIRPMALTVRIAADEVTVTPWEIDYKKYNDPAVNAFFRHPPELEWVRT